MGIRGLTTFIASDCTKCVESYQLHDSYVVLDGLSVVFQLYARLQKRNDSFGGDYDRYARRVRTFFKLLQECNVTPLVVFDGGYERKKLETIKKRLSWSTSGAKRLNPVNEGRLGVGLFPFHLSHLFIDILKELNVDVFRCPLEADNEIANLAYALNCPVISYDSDFYILGVLYIPFPSLDLSKHKLQGASGKYAINCEVYRMEKFMEHSGLNRDVLPLMAVLLGNDYVNKKVFAKFYSQMKLRKCGSDSEQQRHIATIISWLRNETLGSAIEKILNRCTIKRRAKIVDRILIAGCGYMRNRSTALPHFNLIDPAVNVTVERSKFETVVNRFKKSPTHRDWQETIEESSDSDDEIEEEVESDILYDFPYWFVANYRKCLYPTCFIDMVNHNTYFVPIQRENFRLKSSHVISFPLIVKFHQIITAGKRQQVRCVLNGQYETIEATPLRCDTLESINDLNAAESRQLLFTILELDQHNVDAVLNVIPPHWHLYFIAITYWIRNVKDVQMTFAHVHALVLCAIVLGKIDPLIGFFTSANEFDRFKRQLPKIAANLEEQLLKRTAHKKDQLEDITYEESVFCRVKLMKYFKTEPKMRTNANLYNLDIVHAFAQFQSAFLHIKYLNALLKQPFENGVISNFFNGTFVYNMCADLKSRTNIESYLKILLVKSSVPDIAANIVNNIASIFGGKISQLQECRRKKKKKRVNRPNMNDEDEDCIVDEDYIIEENFFMANNMFTSYNKFAALRLV